MKNTSVSSAVYRLYYSKFFPSLPIELAKAKTDEEFLELCDNVKNVCQKYMEGSGISANDFQIKLNIIQLPESRRRSEDRKKKYNNCSMQIFVHLNNCKKFNLLKITRGTTYDFYFKKVA